MSSITLRQGIDALPPYVPGRRPDATSASAGQQPARLASNEQTMAPPRAIIEAITAAAEAANRYPDFGNGALIARLAEVYGVGIDRVAVGNGSSALIRDLVAALCGPGDEVVFAQPSFPYYRNATIAAGARPHGVPLRDFGHDLPALRAAIGPDTKLVFICNPNNPTGTVVDPQALRDFVAEVPENVVVAIDEAYIEFADAADVALDLVRDRANVIVLRTFSKAYGLAGMRVGYAIGPTELIAGMSRLAVPFAVNAVAQAAAVAALEPDTLTELRQRIALGVSERERLAAELVQLGYRVVPSSANFIFLPSEDPDALASRLERADVFVRAIGGGVRITVGLRAENDRVIAALAEG